MMRKKTTSAARYVPALAGTALLCLLLCAPGGAVAVTLYEQTLDATQQGLFSNTGGQVGADDFSRGLGATVTSISWYGYYGVDLLPATTTVTFDLTLFLDTGGSGPGAVYQSASDVSAQVREPSAW